MGARSFLLGTLALAVLGGCGSDETETPLNPAIDGGVGGSGGSGGGTAGSGGTGQAGQGGSGGGGGSGGMAGTGATGPGPNIGSVSSTDLAHGTSYEISGSGFGSKSPVEPLSWDDFEGGALGTPLGAAKVGRGWTHQTENGADCHGDPCTHYDDQVVHAGSQSAKTVNDNYSMNFFGWTSGDQFRELYVRYWRYFDPYHDDLHHICNHKQMYLYNDIGDSPQWLLGAVQSSGDDWPVSPQGDCSQTFTDSYGHGRVTQVRYPGARFRPDTMYTWRRWELYIRNDSPSSAQNGGEYFWMDGQLLEGYIAYSRPDPQSDNLQLTDRENVNLLADDCTTPNVFMQDVRIGAMVHTPDPGGACSSRGVAGEPDVQYMDDVYIDQTRARIEICDSASWSEKDTTGGECAIQIPHTTWDDGTIEFTAHQGALPAGQPLYLYVIDAEGRASQAHQVSFP